MCIRQSRKVRNVHQKSREIDDFGAAQPDGADRDRGARAERRHGHPRDRSLARSAGTQRILEPGMIVVIQAATYVHLVNVDDVLIVFRISVQNACYEHCTTVPSMPSCIVQQTRVAIVTFVYPIPPQPMA